MLFPLASFKAVTKHEFQNKCLTWLGAVWTRVSPSACPPRLIIGVVHINEILYLVIVAYIFLLLAVGCLDSPLLQLREGKFWKPATHAPVR